MLYDFAPGEAVHLVVHGATESFSKAYLDAESGLEVFMDLSGPPAETTVIVP